MNPGITITISAETAAALQKLTQLFSKTEAGASSLVALNGRLQNGTRALNEMAAAAAVVFSVNRLGAFVREGIAGLKVMAQLEAALRSTGNASADFRQELAAARDQLGETLGADDDLTASVQRLLINFGAARAQMPQLTALTFDLAAALGQDATSAATMLGRALAGDDFALRSMRLEIDRTLPKAQQFDQAMAQLETRVGGQARAAFEAAGPAVARLGKEVGDLRKEFGQLLLADVIEPFAEKFLAGIKKMRAGIKSLQADYPVLTASVQATAENVGTLAAKTAPAALGLGAMAVGMTALLGVGRLLNPVLVAGRVGLAALAGVDMIGLLGMVRSVKDLVTVLGMVAPAAATAAAALAALGLAAAIAAQATATGSALLKQEQTAGQAAAAMDHLHEAIKRTLAGQVAAGQVTEAQADVTRRALLEARISWAGGKTSIDEYRRALTEVVDTLKQLPPLPDAKGDAADAHFAAQLAELETAKKYALAAAGQPARNAARSNQASSLDLDYQKGLLSLEAYLARRRTLIQQATDDEVGVLFLALDVSDAAWKTKQDELAALEAEADTPANRAELLRLQAEADALETKAAGIKAAVAAVQLKGGEELEKNKAQAPMGFLDSFRAGAAQLQREWGNLNASLARGGLELLTQGVNGLGNALTSVIMGTQSAGQAFAQFATQMLTSFIGMIVQAILWAEIALPILTALNVLTAGSPAAAGGPITIAAVTGSVAAVMGVAGRERGGPVSAGLPYLVGERRPELFVPQTNGYILPQVPAGLAGIGGSAAAAASPAPIINVVNLSDPAELRRFVESHVGEQIIVNHIARNRSALGMPT